MALDIALSPALDLIHLHNAFLPRRRVRVENFLTADSANQIRQALIDDIPWALVYRDRNETIELDADQLRQLDARQQAAMLRRVHTIAARQFQYLYFSCPLDDEHLTTLSKSSPLHEAIKFLSSRKFIECVESITGIEQLVRVKAQASCYQSGHFLLPHDDGVGDTRRKIAYVLNLSKHWQAGWGGLLQFHDSSDNITEAFLPAHNSLSLFQIPAMHSVSIVAPFAPESRFAISGWLYI